ncbi:MAG: PfkB family carbohydrate kinase [Myxococcota bacterium]
MSLWLVGGHDPTHGAGLFRDLSTAKTLAPSIPRRFAVTALTEQGHGRPARSTPVGAERLRRRLERWPGARVVKLGLVPDSLAATVAAWAKGSTAPVVLDPVLNATDGGALGSSPDGLAPLLDVATVITPNRHEAQALTNTQCDDANDVAQALSRRFPGTAVLLKGGHDPDPEHVVDRLIRGTQVVSFRRPRVPGPDPRGTGCALATAIAALLATGRGLEQAVEGAVMWLDVRRAAWTRGPDGRAHLPD